MEIRRTKREGEIGTRLVFLGSSGAIQIPSFHCQCRVCEAARRQPEQRRTRASLALLGRETTLIDASPDLEFQLEREGIRRVDRIWITHWHFDHIAGLAALGEPSSVGRWPPIELYLPHQVVHHFDQELAYLRRRFRLNAIRPGDRHELPDATWEVVKTAHTDDSVGFIVQAGRRLAYLVDGITPPPETLARLQKLDIIILEATMDSLDEEWANFSLQGAIDCWKQIGTERCILTHLSCHSWENGRLVAGLTHQERQHYESEIPGLEFAYDGMTIPL